MLDASPLKNSYIGKIIHDRYQNHLQQPDGTKTLESILNETLIMLKGRHPNKPLLEPITGKVVNTGIKMNPNSVINADNDKSKPAEIGRYNNVNSLNDIYDKASYDSNSNYECSPRNIDKSFNINPTNEVNNDLVPSF
jgi:hypothetical protein